MRLLKIVSRNLKLISGNEIGAFDILRLKFRKRYSPLQIRFNSKRTRVTDAGSFLGCYEEIFRDENYLISFNTNQPYIIDCGANAGLSIAYFKKIYPECVIEAYEPDPHLFSALDQNIKSWGFNNITLHQAAVWINNTGVKFTSEKGASGKIDDHINKNTVQVAAVRLKNLLVRPVDLLKIDIEGAEIEVLSDCAERLNNVNNLFVEYHSEASKDQQLDQLLGLISQAGFRYHIKEAYSVKHPFVDRKLLAGMDLQLNIFAYRN